MTNNYARWLYTLVVLLTIIAILYLSGWIFGVLRVGSTIVALYFFAWLLQFFLTPLVDFMARYGVPRVLAVSAVYLAITVLVVLALVVSLPAVYNQGTHLANALANPKTYKVISTMTTAIEKILEQRFHIPPHQIADFTRKYSVSLQNGAFKAGTQLQQLIKGHLTPGNLSNSATAFLNFLGTLNTLFLDFVIVLILAFYMTLDGHKLVRRALAYFPPAVGEVMESVHLIVNRKFGGYLRSQVILAISYGLLTYLVAIGFHLHYVIFIAAFAAVMMLIPFIGAFAAVLPALIGFVLDHAADASFPWLSFLLLLLFLGATQHLVINVFAPRVMSSTVGMHPLLVMLGLLLGAEIAGLWGAIFGVPIFGVLMDTIDLIYRRVMERRYHFHPPAPDEFAKLDEPEVVHPLHPPSLSALVHPRHSPRQGTGPPRSPVRRRARAPSPPASPPRRRVRQTWAKLARRLAATLHRHGST